VDDHTGANGGAGNGGNWKVTYTWKVPQSLVPGKSTSITLGIQAESVDPVQPLFIQMTAYAPDFAQAFSINYPNPAGGSKTFPLPLAADQQDSKEITVTVGVLSAQVIYHYKPGPPSPTSPAQTKPGCRRLSMSFGPTGNCTAGQTFANGCMKRIGRDDREYHVFYGLDDPNKPSELDWLKPAINKYIDRIKDYPGAHTTADIPGESASGFGIHSDDMTSSDSDIRKLFGHSDAPADLTKGAEANVFAKATVDYEQLLAARIEASQGNLSPADVVFLALRVTNGSYPLAVLTTHNLLKNLAVATREAVNRANAVFGTKPYQSACRQALVALQNANKVVRKLESLRSAPAAAGDKMGPWYHAFAVLAIGALTNYDGAVAAQQAEQTTKSWGGFAGEARYDHEKNQLDFCWSQVVGELGYRFQRDKAPAVLPSGLVACWAAFGDRG
jgi:hypothetical protein